MGIESSIPVSGDDKPRTDYVDKTYQSWADLKENIESYGREDITIPHSVSAPYERLQRFLSEADEKSIINERKVMKRVKNNGKEWLIVSSTLRSTTWTGEEITLLDYVEGLYEEQTRKPIIDERKRVTAYTRGTPKRIYTIEFSKKNVDKFIGDQDKATILYHISHQGGPQNDYFTYEQFVNNTWEQNQILLLNDGSPQYGPTSPPVNP